MKFEMELHPNFVSDIVVKQLQEMYEHTKEDYFYTDPEETQAAIAVVLDYFMAPSEYEEWVATHRNLAEEVVEGFDHLEKKRKADQQIGAWLSAALHDPSVCPSMKDDINEWFECTPQGEVDRLRAKKKQIYEDLTDAGDREWVGLTEDEVEDSKIYSFDFYAGAKWAEEKLKEKNT